jgi:hypothetical protein
MGRLLERGNAADFEKVVKTFTRLAPVALPRRNFHFYWLIGHIASREPHKL